MDAIQLDRVHKAFGDKIALSDVSLTVPRGALYGLIGPNGSGKTTTMRVVLGLLFPDQGKVSVLGHDGGTRARDRVGYLPEERGLYRKMELRRMLVYVTRLKGLSGRDAEREVDHWLDRLGLAQAVGKKIEELSKGMAQKAQLIAAVASKPDLVILDEPFSGLDPVNAEVLRRAVLGLREGGTTVVLSTHDMRVAEELCDRVAMIFQGKKVLDGTLAEIRNEHGRPHLRVRVAGGRPTLEPHVPAGARVVDRGNEQDVFDVADRPGFLRTLSAACDVERFEVVSPTLHDVFVSIAGADIAREVTGA